MQSWEVREGFLEEALCRCSSKELAFQSGGNCASGRGKGLALTQRGLGNCGGRSVLLEEGVCGGRSVCVGAAAWRLTFIMSTTVLRAIIAMMVYSKGGDTTNCHMRYWKLCLFWGMCRVSGLALMAKSMQALCGGQAVA